MVIQCHHDRHAAVSYHSEPIKKKLFEDSNAMKRIATPDELVGMVLYLMSQASSFTTGQDFLVDGGQI